MSTRGYLFILLLGSRNNTKNIRNIEIVNDRVIGYLILEFLAEKIAPVHVVIVIIAGIADVACVHQNIRQELSKRERKKKW